MMRIASRLCTVGGLTLGLAFGLGVGAVRAEDDRLLELASETLAPWSISGSNTLRSEYYGVKGDPASSPYADEGWENYDELSLSFSRRVNPYRTWRGQVTGVWSESRYRAQDNGITPERVNLLHECGDTGVPFRLELGDVYTHFSARTLQRSLKGLQLEFQPHLGGETQRHSFVFVSGTGGASWRHFRARDDYSNGMSWLFQDETLGRYSVNAAHNRRDGDDESGALDRTQYVLSVAGEKRVTIGSETLTIEGELGHFTGDHDGTAGAESGQDNNANALFLQVSGRGETPLTYRFRHEAYGEHYRPNGAAAGADRRSWEGHGGWRFENGLQLRGRVQHFRDGWESANWTDTKTVGINLAGPFLRSTLPDLSGSLDAFIQDVEDEDNTANQVVRSLSLNLSKPLSEGWNGRLGLYYQDMDNQLRDTQDTVTKHVSLAVDHAVQFLGCRGSVAPGVLIRDTHGPGTKNVDVYPTFSMNLTRGAHSLDYSMAYNYQDRRSAQTEDVGTFSHNLNYRYTRGPDTVGLRVSTEHRDPDDSTHTDSYLASVFWTHAFSKPAREAKHDRGEPGPVAPAGPVRVRGGAAPDLRDMVPGTGLDTVRRHLAAAGVTGLSEQSGLVVCETRVLEEIDQRQRLALVHAGGRLQTAAIVIEFDDVGRPDDMMQTFERVREELIAMLGRPDEHYDKGDVTANLADDVRAGRFIRVNEWRGRAGTIRFGIPRRLDGQVRMEVQFAQKLPPATDPLWSIERVR